jgi:hypothetical protein
MYVVRHVARRVTDSMPSFYLGGISLAYPKMRQIESETFEFNEWNHFKLNILPIGSSRHFVPHTPMLLGYFL